MPNVFITGIELVLGSESVNMKGFVGRHRTVLSKEKIKSNISETCKTGGAPMS